MVLDPDLLIHIGYHKTGSSYLQRVVFQHPELPFSMLNMRHPDTTIPIIYAHPFEFDAESARETLMRQAAEVAEAGRQAVFSQEGLSGFLHLGGFNSMQIKERLALVAPEAKILICIREQEAMLLSFHNQYVRRGGRKDIRAFLGDDIDAYKGFQKVHLAFHHLIGAYQDAFGKERVCIAPMELLARDPAAFTKEILDFVQPTAGWNSGPLPSNLETVINPSIPPVGIAAKRQMNRFFAMKQHFPIDNGPLIVIGRRSNNKIKAWAKILGRNVPRSINDKLKHRYRDIIREQVGDYYVSSNQKTAELTGLDLAALGYRT